MVLDYPFVWPLWNAAENSQRQVCKQSLTLSESTTRDGLCSALDTPQEALRPTSCGELIRGRYYPQIAPRKGDASPLLNEITRSFRSWFHCVARLGSFPCLHVRLYVEMHRSFVARFPVKIAH